MKKYICLECGMKAGWWRTNFFHACNPKSFEGFATQEYEFKPLVTVAGNWKESRCK